MAAKSKKVTIKTKRAKVAQVGMKTDHKHAQHITKASKVDLEMVPDPMPPEVLKHLTKVEDFFDNSTHMEERELLHGIIEFSKRAADYAQQAVQFGGTALVYAWACGKLLNAAKSKLGRGKFGAWRIKTLESNYISERTSQRYMQLATQYPEVKPLLQWSPGLRQAYIACGILPESPEKESAIIDKSTAIQRQALLSSITGIQRKLRLFADLKGQLDASDKTQLQLAKNQIDEFFSRILD